MNKVEYKTIEVKIPKLSELELKRNINDSLYCIKEINNLIIKDEQELYIRELLNRITKSLEFIDEYRFDLELPSRQEELREILRGEK